ncbi:MAG: hypothetical protein Fur0042_10990 [Cyanophyceae cyanobacterium]
MKAPLRRLIPALALSVLGAISVTNLPAAEASTSTGRSNSRTTLRPYAPYDPYSFEGCATTLASFGLEDDRIAVSCAYVLRPEQLEACTAHLMATTPATIDQAVDHCRLSRRPVEMAQCTSAIQTLNPTEEVAPVLDHCRRTLLPLRLADCVTGLQTALDRDRDLTMAQCIDGRDRPRDFYPAYPGSVTSTDFSPEMAPAMTPDMP